MKRLLDDIQAENFTKREFVVYGVLVPLAFVVITILAGLVE